MHRPGAVEIHGAIRNASLPSRSRFPHSIVSVLSPNPRNVSALVVIRVCWNISSACVLSSGAKDG